MKNIPLVYACIALFVAALPARAADDDALTRMAMCKDSWYEWNQSDPAKLKAFGDHFRTEFVPHGNDPYFLPKTTVTMAGMKVVQAFPDSVGMGVGFSLTVDAPYDKVRKTVEKLLGKPLSHCENSDGMKTCELDIAEKRDFTIMAGDDPKATQTLIGCYYFYEK